MRHEQHAFVLLDNENNGYFKGVDWISLERDCVFGSVLNIRGFRPVLRDCLEIWERMGLLHQRMKSNTCYFAWVFHSMGVETGRTCQDCGKVVSINITVGEGSYDRMMRDWFFFFSFLIAVFHLMSGMIFFLLLFSLSLPSYSIFASFRSSQKSEMLKCMIFSFVKVRARFEAPCPLGRGRHMIRIQTYSLSHNDALFLSPRWVTSEHRVTHSHEICSFLSFWFWQSHTLI